MTLAIEAVGKSFPGVRALDNVSMTFAAGEVHALMGETGPANPRSSRSSRDSTPPIRAGSSSTESLSPLLRRTTL
jgi:ABC-type dipeptide/oligopeptide/nickel transport system ATPase component